FTVKLVDNSYVVPPYSTTTVDQYTGKETTTTSSGYRVEQKFIEVTIKNQPFTSYTNENNKEINLYYTVQVKGHFGEDWQTFGHVQHFGSSTHVSSSPYTVQSDSGYTVVTSIANYAAGSQLDFKAQAVTGYLYNSNTDRLIPPWYLVSAEASSDWSNIQIFTIPDSPTVSVSPSQTTTLPPVTSDGNGQPQPPEQTQPPNSIFSNPFFMLGISILLGGVVISVIMAILKKQLKPPINTNNNLPP
ncbi:MAG: hypothetical protein LBC03_06340, partial [Nitrososphaerota archaeon]|nr:hypothetical protein [Nitrososphaerota archaeon]